MRILLAAIFAMSGAQAQAHEIWIEKDSSGPARIYLGEPDYPTPEGGDKEFHRLRAPQVFQTNAKEVIPVVRRSDHLEANISGKGDIRLRDDDIFAPEMGEDGKYAARIYYAKAGRAEIAPKLDFEVVPLEPGGSTFQILFQGKPTPKEGVRIIRPDGWLKNIKSDQNAQFTVPTDISGRYLLFVDHNEAVNRQLDDKAVSKITHVTTLTFVQP
ncbi:DUF4198 domain-containing protein [Sphingosinicella microcystinivorans]|uniref:GH25 family protein n=3 Tax=Sphingosinicella microcystinivorans TaxID=335406 RepID=A0ABX9T0X0_SPHMI|nr:DUF4198 domain-containing protein [Sphingosinicella microcystinivorans]RKS91050.1 hypothetical protein DFR51_0598 [Sphingosinicella microcystinivorans]